MTSTSLAGLRAKLYQRLGLPTDDTFIDTTVANAIINQAQQTVDLAFPWPWCVKTATVTEAPPTPDEGVYTMDADYVAMISVSTRPTAGVGYRLLVRRPYDEVRMVWQSSGGSAIPVGLTTVPSMWAEYTHGAILTAPQMNPDAALEFRFRCTTPPMTGDAALPLHPTRFDEMYVAYAAYLAGLRFRELPETGGALAQFDSLLERFSKVFPSQGFSGAELTAEQGKVTPAERT